VTGNHVQDEWRAPLDDLRTLRESLREEEQRVSYWRQLVQGRLDLVRTALEGGHPSADDLASLAAARSRDGARRRSPAATSLALEGLVSSLAGLPPGPARADRRLHGPAGGPLPAGPGQDREV